MQIVIQGYQYTGDRVTDTDYLSEAVVTFEENEDLHEGFIAVSIEINGAKQTAIIPRNSYRKALNILE